MTGWEKGYVVGRNAKLIFNGAEINGKLTINDEAIADVIELAREMGKAAAGHAERLAASIYENHPGPPPGWNAKCSVVPINDDLDDLDDLYQHCLAAKHDLTDQELEILKKCGITVEQYLDAKGEGTTFR